MIITKIYAKLLKEQIRTMKIRRKNKYKAILFDIDDTLCSTDISKEKVSEDLYKNIDKFKIVPLEKFKAIVAAERKKYSLKSYKNSQSSSKA